MPPTHDQEELLNGKLAELLAAQGLDARAERRESGKRMDIVVDVGGARVVLEAEAGFSAAKRREAVKDADARLRQGLTTVVFAICYPDGATTDTLAESKPIWAARTRAELSAGADARWSEPGGIPELAEAVRQAGGAVGDADGAAQILSEALDAAVQRLSKSVRSALAREMDLPQTKVERGSPEDGYFTAAKRAMLVVATAMLFHHRLQGHLPSDHPAGYAERWPPLAPRQCAAEPETTVGEFLEAWRAILAVDYRPVFETARVALLALPATPDIAQAVHTLAGEVAKIAGLVHGLRHDLLGRIFHRVLDTARYDGSFYTSTPAAVLLAALAIREEDCDWSDPNAVERLRICDPACGTGTLLMAAAERIRDLRQQAGPINDDDEQILALALVENVLWGYDINLTATHMAASTLGMLSPSTKFGRMNVHRTLLGVYNGTPYLGSLEFLSGQPRLASWPSISQQVDAAAGGEPPEQPPQMDLVIMNPPFTRSDIRHDQFSPEDEAALKSREKEIVVDMPDRQVGRLHSSGGMFTALAEQMLKRDGAANLGLVLPLVVPTSTGNAALRRFLASRFHVDLVISSHDPQRIFFSEDTTIGEVLIVCRRWLGNGDKPPTRFINLAENPRTPIDALETARLIQSNAAGPYTVQTFEAERVAAADWSAVNFFSPVLVDSYRQLADSRPVANSPQFVPLEDLADVGPQGRRIHDVYERSSVPTTSGRHALWYLKTTVTQSMRAKTDVWIEPKADRKSLADDYWEQRGRLLLPHRLRLTVARVVAAMLDTPTLGQQWTPCRPHDGSDASAAALCSYFNSSIGVLALLGERRNRVPQYPSLALDTLRAIPVPNIPELGDDIRDALAAAYEELKDEVLLPFPRMDEDPVRKRLDAAVADALELDPEWVAQIRRALSEEPSVTNRRYAGLAT